MKRPATAIHTDRTARRLIRSWREFSAAVRSANDRLQEAFEEAGVSGRRSSPPKTPLRGFASHSPARKPARAKVKKLRIAKVTRTR